MKVPVIKRTKNHTETQCVCFRFIQLCFKVESHLVEGKESVEVHVIPDPERLRTLIIEKSWHILRGSLVLSLSFFIIVQVIFQFFFYLFLLSSLQCLFTDELITPYVNGKCLK